MIHPDSQLSLLLSPCRLRTRGGNKNKKVQIGDDLTVACASTTLVVVPRPSQQQVSGLSLRIGSSTEAGPLEAEGSSLAGGVAAPLETLGRVRGRGRGCGEGARVREAASAGQPDGVGGEESAQQQTTPVRPFFYSRDDL